MASFWPYDRNWNTQETDFENSNSPTKINSPRWKEIQEKRHSTEEKQSEDENNTTGNSPIPNRRNVTKEIEGEEVNANNLYSESYESMDQTR